MAKYTWFGLQSTYDGRLRLIFIPGQTLAFAGQGPSLSSSLASAMGFAVGWQCSHHCPQHQEWVYTCCLEQTVIYFMLLQSLGVS